MKLASSSSVRQMRQVLEEAFKSLRGKPFDLFKAYIKTRLESIPQGLTARGVKRFLRRSRLYIRPSLETTKTAMVLTEDVEHTEESTELNNKTKQILSSREQRDEHGSSTSSSTLQANHGSSSTLQVSQLSSARLQASQLGDPSTLQASQLGSSSTLQANHGSSSTLQANHGSSSTLQASQGSSSTLQANHGSSSTLQANHGSSSTLQANHGSSSTLQANHGSSSTLQPSTADLRNKIKRLLSSLDRGNTTDHRSETRANSEDLDIALVHAAVEQAPRHLVSAKQTNPAVLNIVPSEKQKPMDSKLPSEFNQVLMNVVPSAREKPLEIVRSTQLNKDINENQAKQKVTYFIKATEIDAADELSPSHDIAIMQPYAQPYHTALNTPPIQSEQTSLDVISSLSESNLQSSSDLELIELNTNRTIRLQV